MSQQLNINDYFKKAYAATESSQNTSRSEEEVVGKRKREEDEAMKEVERGSSGRSEEGSVSTNSSKKKKERVPKEQAPSIQLSDSEAEESEGEWESVKDQKRIFIPPKDAGKILPMMIPSRVMTSRFNLVVKHSLPADVNKQVNTTMVVINTILRNIKEDGINFGWQGYPVIIPWRDEEVYEDRALGEFLYKDFHEKKELQVKKALTYLKEYIFKWNLLPRQAAEKEQGDGIKYFQVQIGWIFEEQTRIIPMKSLWQEVVVMANEELDRVSLKTSNTQAVDPVAAIQFLNSALNISGTWDDLGHADCTKDLMKSIRTVLGTDIEVGLVSRKFDGGKYSDKTPQVMMVECDRKDAPKVQKELVEAFAKMDNSDMIPHSKTSKMERIKMAWLQTGLQSQPSPQ